MFNTKDAAFILRSIVLKGPYNKIIKIRDVNRTVIHQMVFFTFFFNHKVIRLYKHIILSMLSCRNVKTYVYCSIISECTSMMRGNVYFSTVRY